MNTTVVNREHARRLLAELKALYGQLSREDRENVRDQLLYCAEHCVPTEEEEHV
ncbi:MAG: hypothetical protein ACE14L_14675 [Terriglobales bacterium]